MSELHELNTRVVEEFRANEGRVGGRFDGAPMALVHTVGARSGRPRVSPMMYQQVGDAYAVFASNGGADRHPAWYHNLLAYPDTEIEVGTRTVPVRARELPPAERDPIWETQKERFPGFAGYEAGTDRVIPVILLEPR